MTDMPHHRPEATAHLDLHLHVLLDRSGSMATMASDVIGGFNALLAEQAADGDDAVMTLVQFDTQDAHEVLADAVPIAEVVPLSTRTFVPRGGTPLLDATGRLLARAAERVDRRARAGLPPERMVFVTITDGQENQSREYSLATIRHLIQARQQAGWSFAFLGAGIDAYAEAGAMGYDPRSVQAFAPSGAGAQAAMHSVSRSTKAMRSKLRASTHYDAGDFFGGRKEAEDGLGNGTNKA
jgi:uncharacterized protein YegL